MTKLKTPESALAEVSQEAEDTILAVAKSGPIESQEDFADNDKMLHSTVAAKKKIEDMRLFFVGPLNEQVKRINAMFKGASVPVLDAEAVLRRRASAWLAEVARKQEAEEARLLKIREQANAKREEKGIAPIETPVPTVERQEVTTHSAIGSTTARKVWKFRVTSLDAVPRQYLRCEIAAQAVNVAMRQGVRQIDGLEIYEDFETAVKV